MHRGRWAALLVLLLAGCADGGERGGPGAAVVLPAALPAVPGVEAEAVLYRSDVAVGDQFQVRVTNTGTAPFTVTSVQLDSPGFAPVAPRAIDVEFPAGRTFALPTHFGAVDCDAAPEPQGARLTLTRAGGLPEELLVPLSGTVLDEVHHRQCAIEAATAVAGVSVQGLVAGPDAVTGEVVLTRGEGAEPVVVSELQRSVVLEPVLGVPLPATLAAGDAELRLPVTVRPATCDSHALAETKQPFRFPMLVTVGTGDTVPVPLPLDDGQRALLQDLLGRVCHP